MSIIYTSGTTGLPKGCVLTQGYYMRVAASFEELVGLRDDDAVISPAAFPCGVRMMVIASCLRKGLTAMVEPAFQATFLQRAVDTRATVMVGVAATGAGDAGSARHREYRSVTLPSKPPRGRATRR